MEKRGSARDLMIRSFDACLVGSGGCGGVCDRAYIWRRRRGMSDESRNAWKVLRSEESLRILPAL